MTLIETIFGILLYLVGALGFYNSISLENSWWKFPLTLVWPFATLAIFVNGGVIDIKKFILYLWNT